MRSTLSLLPMACLVGCAGTLPPAPADPAPPPTPAPQAAPAAVPPAHQAEPPLSWWHDAVFYEIFVRSFYDSDGDGIGDLRGIIEQLDYLNDGDPTTHEDLGVTALWLMPIFSSPSYHGYDVVDYYAVEPDYGTEEDLRALLDACHARGIHVILDFMLNHTSNQHPWFQDSASGPDAAHRAWYIWRDDNPGWSQPWGGGGTWHRRGDQFFYGVFWEGMPDLDFTNPEVEEEFAAIGEHWLGLGVDGFRLDAIRHLVEDGSSAPDVAETHVILKRLRARWKANHPQALIVGEVWSGPQDTGPYWGQGDELDLTYDFHLSGGIVGALSQGRAQPLAQALEDDLTWLPVQRMSAPFVTNHDMERIASILGGDQARLKMAATALMTLPGTPFVYYGEEIGLKNTGVGGDEAKRAPMQWTAEAPNFGFTDAAQPWAPPLGVAQKYSVAAQEGDPSSLLAHYKAMIALRQASPALSTGTVYGPRADADGPRLSFQRAVDGQVVVVALNFSGEAAEGPSLTLDPAALKVAGLAQAPRLKVRSLMGEGPAAPSMSREEALAVGTIPPWGGRIYAVEAAE